MSERMHVPKKTKHENYNKLLTSLGEEIKNRARGNIKEPFPNNRKMIFYSHIQWKLIPTPVNQDCPPPERTCVLGQEKGLKVSPGNKQFAAWLIVKKG